MVRVVLRETRIAAKGALKGKGKGKGKGKRLSAVEEDVSPYEQIRLENMKRNHARMVALRLVQE